MWTEILFTPASVPFPPDVLDLQCKDGLQELLDVAKEVVPAALWSSTPLVLRATAGLRLLPGEKATHLLDKVSKPSYIYRRPRH